MIIDIDAEREYQDDTESNVEQDVEDIKERRFAEADSGDGTVPS